ncbi:UxaA family hydrolase [Sinorhizobium meliloti]|jgi:altronate hydrolase|uniref:Altronate hydrolase, UxaA family n=3 Tax=Rhizobium meliloti TaxID=382 RepID=F7X2F9_SINMM|nr:altronate dehydratase family protein [Sinorhizobium meliloti]TWA90181.1 altronate hydrolase [Ensifer sp. SEMIA 134]TWB26788.1 altronate hydrolase [Ensifer sp. SEMIA 135]AEG06021.1 Altronate dehydratase [Sinorhizobium meliloti BL225C]AEG55055.1 Altronate dehydratase [Sinorhizobium meliloti AK83]AEH80717.1 altronate hydrolase, UxaA family [Sinorhizobium meliloti SM11]
MLETVREELDLPAPSSILLSPDDNVVVATAAIAPGDRLAGGVSAVARIEPGHKAAIRRIDVGEPVVKYGQAIGRATSPIAPGEHVHSHNLAFDQGRLAVGAAVPPEAASEADKARTFLGYRRADGRAATRNYIGIVASVNCSTTVCRAIADEANRRILPKYEGIDGFVPIVHDQGCGMSSTGDGMKNLHRTLAGYARHANFGGVLMVGLGCEVNQLTLYGQSGAGAEKRHFNIQEAGGSRRSVERALGILDEIAKEVAAARRVPIPVSEIIVGLQCGGSDGLSGITANPALGAAVDILAAAGGTAILSETSEIYGAEHLLRSRAVNETVAVKLDGLIAWWEDYVAMHGASLDNNPSPGNKRGGLTTILEKSLGAVAKGGRSPLTAVYNYAERVTEPGLVFMDTPGYDPVSATGQVAGGANVIAFTTGRGSCFGCRPAPSIKLTSNTALYRAMEEDMDIDCGVIASGETTIADLGRGIFELIIETASGRKTKSELFGYGDNEFVPWHLGATL